MILQLSSVALQWEGNEELSNLTDSLPTTPAAVRATVVSLSETSAHQSISTGPEANAQPMNAGAEYSVA